MLRKPIGDRAMTPAERQTRCRAIHGIGVPLRATQPWDSTQSAHRLSTIAILAIEKWLADGEDAAVITWLAAHLANRDTAFLDKLRTAIKKP
jgi:hypothetical protein